MLLFYTSNTTKMCYSIRWPSEWGRAKQAGPPVWAQGSRPPPGRSPGSGTTVEQVPWPGAPDPAPLSASATGPGGRDTNTHGCWISPEQIQLWGVSFSRCSHLDSVGHHRGWQQQNKALNPHKEELYYKVGDADGPQNLPETQRLDVWAEEDEAGRRSSSRWETYWWHLHEAQKIWTQISYITPNSHWMN